MFELTPIAPDILFCLLVGGVGWLIFSDFQIRSLSFSQTIKGARTLITLVLRAPLVIFSTFDEQSTKIRRWIIFFAVQNSIPFLGFPLQLLYIPYFNTALWFFWAMTWILCLIFLSENRAYEMGESGKSLTETLDASFFVSAVLGFALTILFDPNQTMVGFGQAPFDAKPFSSSSDELLIVAFLLLPYIGFIGYLIGRYFFLKNVEGRNKHNEL